MPNVPQLEMTSALFVRHEWSLLLTPRLYSLAQGLSALFTSQVDKRLTGPAVRLMLTAVGVLFAIVRVNMLVHAVCRR